MTGANPGAQAGGRRGLSDNLRAALWILTSALCFTGMTTLIKYLGHDYPAPLQTFYSQTICFLFVLPIIVKRGWRAYETKRPVWFFVRAITNIFALLLTFYAYHGLPLADANALSFTKGLWLAPLAAFVAHERLGPLRIIAALVGFGGVLLMTRPGAHAFVFNLPTLAMLGSSFLYALAIINMKMLSREHAPAIILVWSMTLTMLFSIPGAILTWRWPAPQDLGLLLLMGVFAYLQQMTYIRGINLGDASALAPIDYIRLIFGATVGIVLFNDIPTVWTWAGAAVVVASTLFLTWREHRAAQARLVAGSAVSA